MTDLKEPRWLDDAAEPGKRRLRQSLDEAEPWSASDVRQRRVWARLQNVAQEGERARRATRRAFVLGAMATAAVGAAAFVLVQRVRPAVMTSGGDVAVAVSPAERAPSAPQVVPLPSPPAPAPAVSAPGAPPVLTRSQTVETGGAERLVRALSDGVEVDIQPRSVLAVDGRGRPEVRDGRVGFKVAPQPAGQPFVVRAAAYSVVVVGTRFVVKVDRGAGGVTVTVAEGVVEVRDNRARVVGRVAAGQSWSQPIARGRRGIAVEEPKLSPSPSPSLSLSPSPSPSEDPARDLADARAARAASDPRRAAAIYERLAGRAGPVAENALYELGGVYRDQLKSPRQALAAWQRYRARYPGGLLRAEADLSIVDTLSSLGDTRRALKEAEAFLTRYPRSERRAEVARVAAEARRALGVSDGDRAP